MCSKNSKTQKKEGDEESHKLQESKKSKKKKSGSAVPKKNRNLDSKTKNQKVQEKVLALVRKECPTKLAATFLLFECIATLRKEDKNGTTK